LSDLRHGQRDERLLLLQLGFELRHFQFGEHLTRLLRLIGADSGRASDLVADVNMHFLDEPGEFGVDRRFLERCDLARLLGDANESFTNRLDRRYSHDAVRGFRSCSHGGRGRGRLIAAASHGRRQKKNQ
jgi:hypothetical protein